MTLTIELTLEEERRLEQAAQTAGVDLAQYARRVLLGASPPDLPLYVTATQEEWERTFVAWVESHDPLPALPPESFERAGFYGERG